MTIFCRDCAFYDNQPRSWATLPRCRAVKGKLDIVFWNTRRLANGTKGARRQALPLDADDSPEAPTPCGPEAKNFKPRPSQPPSLLQRILAWPRSK